MWMGAIAVGQDGKAELPIAITQQESRVARDTATVSKVTIAVAHFGPPGQSEASRFISPDTFYAAFELIVLSSEHLIECLFTDESLPFKYAAVEIADKPVRLI